MTNNKTGILLLLVLLGCSVSILSPSLTSPWLFVESFSAPTLQQQANGHAAVSRTRRRQPTYGHLQQDRIKRRHKLLLHAADAFGDSTNDKNKDEPVRISSSRSAINKDSCHPHLHDESVDNHLARNNTWSAALATRLQEGKQPQIPSNVKNTMSRRHLLSTILTTTTLLNNHQPAWAAPSSDYYSLLWWQQPTNLYVVSPRTRNATSSPATPLNFGANIANSDNAAEISLELCLLKLLPIRNDRKVVFRALQSRIEGISAALKGMGWERVSSSMQEAVSFLDKRRDQLEPVFNDEDGTLLAINKAEEGEFRIEALRQALIDVQTASSLDYNTTLLFCTQKRAFLALARVGELLVANFPYDVPEQGKFSFLPRLLGRARVTFTLTTRRGKTLGNVTILADGFTAPITAGNFVDLAQRGFYSGLPLKSQKKRLQGPSLNNGNTAASGASVVEPFDVANFLVMGSYQEGFYDPLTAKLRRIPLEMIRVEKSNGVAALSYTQGLSPSSYFTGQFFYNPFETETEQSSSSTAATNAKKRTVIRQSKEKTPDNGIVTPSTVALEPTSFSKPLLSFAMPGIVAMNHPNFNPNGGSSEFFVLQQGEGGLAASRRAWLDGEYAPFGYIIEGMDLVEQLRPGDVIESTTVDEWGLLNLVKLRKPTFSEVVQAAGSAAETVD